MTKAVSTPITSSASERRLAVLPAALDAYLVRLPHPVAVQFARPVEAGAPVLIEGDLIAAMYARGTVHHYRVAAQGGIWLVPAVWLTPAAREAARVFDRAQADDTALLNWMRALLTTLRERNRERIMAEAGA